MRKERAWGWALAASACALLAACQPVVSGGGGVDADSDPVASAPSGWTRACFETFDASSCDGARYVSYNATYQKYVGVVLCAEDRYKLYLGESEGGVFYQIGDYAGHGQDHCELVNPTFTLPDEDDIQSGGCVDCATSADSSWYANPVGTQGYSRGVFGEGFTFEPLWPEYNLYTVDWLSCGVSFPAAGDTCGGSQPPSPGVDWTPASFVDTGVSTPCTGERYVRFDQGYGLYVGVALCSPTRYKIFLGEALDGVFHQIGDYAGHGQDHCELVNPGFTIPNEDDIRSGGCMDCATSVEAGSLYENPAGSEGWSRATFGGSFTFEPVWPEYNLYTVAWYECGVAIP
ncbi:hypothetical protein [Chondromyces crocatus]|nr:hypothetical protein [Chondromyces crocatus]